MAFPTIATADTKNGTVTSNSTSWTLTYPTNIAADNLLLAFVATDGDNSGGWTWPAGWEKVGLAGFGANVTLIAAKKKATGSETGNFTVTMGASEQGGWRVFRITGWEGTLGDFVGTPGAVDAGGGAAANDANPNPGSLNPGGWDVEDTLWFAVCACDNSRTISAYPLANNQSSDNSGGAGGATLGICTLNDAVASKDPGTFTTNTGDDWAAETFAVRPAAPAAAFAPPFYPKARHNALVR